MREVTEQGNVYKYSGSCCSALCPLNSSLLVIISLSMVTQARFGGEKRLKSRSEEKRGGEIRGVKVDCTSDFLKGKCEQSKWQDCQEAGEAVEMSLMGQQRVTVLILDGKRVKFGGISPLTSEQMPGSKIAVFFLKSSS